MDMDNQNDPAIYHEFDEKWEQLFTIDGDYFGFAESPVTELVIYDQCPSAISESNIKLAGNNLTLTVSFFFFQKLTQMPRIAGCTHTTSGNLRPVYARSPSTINKELLETFFI